MCMVERLGCRCETAGVCLDLGHWTWIAGAVWTSGDTRTGGRLLRPDLSLLSRMQDNKDELGEHASKYFITYWQLRPQILERVLDVLRVSAESQSTTVPREISLWKQYREPKRWESTYSTRYAAYPQRKAAYPQRKEFHHYTVDCRAITISSHELTTSPKELHAKRQLTTQAGLTTMQVMPEHNVSASYLTNPSLEDAFSNLTPSRTQGRILQAEIHSILVCCYASVGLASSMMTRPFSAVSRPENAEHRGNCYQQAPKMASRKDLGLLPECCTSNQRCCQCSVPPSFVISLHPGSRQPFLSSVIVKDASQIRLIFPTRTFKSPVDQILHDINMPTLHDPTPSTRPDNRQWHDLPCPGHQNMVTHTRYGKHSFVSRLKCP